MSADLVRELARGGWLTLALMMLLSRVLFQVHGAVRMRAFLDGWQTGAVKRVWGALALVYAVLLVVAVATCSGGLSHGDWIVIITLLAVLVADGGVNVLPAGFETFKDKLQRGWVRRTGRTGDGELFGVVNALLAAGSLAVCVLVLAYRPVAWETVAAASAAAVVLTVGLLGAANPS